MGKNNLPPKEKPEFQGPSVLNATGLRFIHGIGSTKEFNKDIEQAFKDGFFPPGPHVTHHINGTPHFVQFMIRTAGGGEAEAEPVMQSEIIGEIVVCEFTAGAFNDECERLLIQEGYKCVNGEPPQARAKAGSESEMMFTVTLVKVTKSKIIKPNVNLKLN